MGGGEIPCGRWQLLSIFLLWDGGFRMRRYLFVYVLLGSLGPLNTLMCVSVYSTVSLWVQKILHGFYCLNETKYYLIRTQEKEIYDRNVNCLILESWKFISEDMGLFENVGIWINETLFTIKEIFKLNLVEVRKFKYFQGSPAESRKLDISAWYSWWHLPDSSGCTVLPLYVLGNKSKASSNPSLPSTHFSYIKPGSKQDRKIKKKNKIWMSIFLGQDYQIHLWWFEGRRGR